VSGEQQPPVPHFDDTVWVMWTWMPGRIGWVSQRRPYSSRQAMDRRAEEWRHFLRSCGLPGIVEVRSEADGEPDDPEQIDSPGPHQPPG